MARFFINRPIFAWVLSILIMGVGILSILNLPVAQYPQIAPPTVSVSAAYPGASAETITNTVTQVIEQQMTGLDGLRYFSSSSTSAGTANVTLTFETGTDADIAQVQVQNKVSQATALLPEIVQRLGLTVEKSSSGFLMVVALSAKDDSFNRADLADYVSTNLIDEISRIDGVGNVQLFGAPYAMRIWLDPSLLAAYELTPTDVTAAVGAENAQISAGAFGDLPTVEGQQLNATITAQSLLRTPEDFRQIVLRAETDGGLVLLGDVARVEIGSESYSTIARYKRAAAAGMGISLSTGANALETAEAVEERMQELSSFFPEGIQYVIPYNTAPFVKISIEEVVMTLAEAIVLVFLVMYLFLQNIRATLIPTLAIPVVLLGTFAILSVAGYSINTLTMLAMVLAIGLLVDDAIVVVENVERIMEEEGLNPLEATRKSMDQVSSSLVGIAIVVSAVFVPMAFFGGSTGVIYQQFAITIVSAMVLSVFVALTLTPALCATLLRAPKEEGKNRLFGPFNKGFDWVQHNYTGSINWITHRPFRMGILYLALAAGMALLFLRTPTGFLPDEDQGILFTLVQTPSGSTAERTLEVIKSIEDHYLDNESDAVEAVFGIVGFSFAGQGQNMGLVFVSLKDWAERNDPSLGVKAIAGRAFGALSKIKDAFVFPIVPPSVIELGNVSGFDFYLQARAGQTHEELLQARNQLLGGAAQSPLIASARPNGVEDAAQFNLDLDWRRAGALGVSASDVSQLLTTAWSGQYVNDFLDQGRIKKVYVQGEADSRSSPEDFELWRVRNATGGLVPLSEFSTGNWTFGPQGITRYNGLPSMQVQGAPAPGVSTGEAIAEIERLAAELPAGFAVSWTGLSLEEQDSGSQAPLLFGLALAVVFLSMAALYESWSIPFAVLLAMPIGIFGALLAAFLGGFANGVFFQISLLAVMGLTGKNAILIVEFAKERREEGMELYEAVSMAARQRFRPILMTSIAFSLGVLPLVLSTGAGSGGRTAIGSGVLGGTITATLLGIAFVPLFFVIIARVFGKSK
ncbi:efflux RND transporter permease subunit [Granulosicoccus antarcticus]|uniref:Efflux pump membrane transporter n=1 Tax=Granulosicoccus antarcticus IMCC3135 TaxID=1192854 RepID=A0A2Z2NU52_9GAMM|nr:efflux RND transporter permease subunit [Granulosicoccus antarcticus]ASJ74025.1 Multidrug efflux pump subunit AcrB [Granulosicoccus antarcticus IMCC3135]